MRFHLLSLFPNLIKSALSEGVVAQAIERKTLSVEVTNPRDFASGAHKNVDDKPFGGADGMLMMTEPLHQALLTVRLLAPKARCIYLSARGKTLTDARARELARESELILICGRYAGVDQRFLAHHEIEELSIGDYVLSGGEYAALVLLDAVARFVPGVLGNEASSDLDSFAKHLLEAPQFTRPREWEGLSVPEALLSGDHKRINEWNHLMSILSTASRRPDLLPKAELSQKDVGRALKLLESLSEADLKVLGFGSAENIRKRLL